MGRAIDVSNLYARTRHAARGSGGHPEPGLPELAGLFRERHAELVRLAALVVGDRQTAEDVVQDVFARLCAKRMLPDGEASSAASGRRATSRGPTTRSAPPRTR